MDDYLYIRVRGKVQGPLTLDQLRMMASRGQFSRLHEVSTDGANWVRASSRPELFPSPSRTASDAVVPASASDDLPIELEEILLEPAPALSSQRASYDAPISTPGGQWFYTQGSTQQGPVDFAQLRQLVDTGDVTAEDLVWTEGMPEWVPVSERRDLFSNAMPATSVSSSYANASGRYSPGSIAGTTSSADAKTSGLAIASLVLGLLGWNLLPVLGSLLAVIFGHSAMREIRRSNGKVTGSGMATAGMVMGYFVLIAAVMALIIVLIVAIVAALRGTG